METGLNERCHGLPLPWGARVAPRFRKFASAYLIGVVLAGSLLGVPLPRATAASGGGVPAFGHVFVIVGENMEASGLNVGNAPYLLGTLAPQAAYLTRYYAITHHSLSNYVAMTSGQYTLCERHDDPPAQCHQDVDNVFHQLDVAGISWREWMESMDAPCSLYTPSEVSPADPYLHTHNPVIYYDNIEGPGGIWSGTNGSAECQANVLPMGAADATSTVNFDATLAAGNVSRFNFIVPNACEDGHTACAPHMNRPVQFDRFLAREVPRILASPAFRANGVLIITFDEGAARHMNFHDRVARGGRVLTIVLSPLVRPGVYTTILDHYSLLRTLEDGFRLPSLGRAAQAAPIDMIWS